jgi:hypothetical protein
MATDFRALLRAEARKLEELAEQNQRRFERMLPGDSSRVGRSAGGGLELPRGTLADDDPLDLSNLSRASRASDNRRAPLPLEHQHQQQQQQHQQQSANTSNNRLSVRDLFQPPPFAHHDDPYEPRQLSVRPADAPARQQPFSQAQQPPLHYHQQEQQQHHHHHSQQHQQQPAMYDTEPPLVPFHSLAAKSVPVDEQAEFRVVGFLLAFAAQDRLLVGMHLRLLHTFYSSSSSSSASSSSSSSASSAASSSSSTLLLSPPAASPLSLAVMLPDDLVRLCRAAGLMDGPHAFSNPDIFAVATGVLERLREAVSEGVSA